MGHTQPRYGLALLGPKGHPRSTVADSVATDSVATDSVATDSVATDSVATDQGRLDYTPRTRGGTRRTWMATHANGAASLKKLRQPPVVQSFKACPWPPESAWVLRVVATPRPRGLVWHGYVVNEGSVAVREHRRVGARQSWRQLIELSSAAWRRAGWENHQHQRCCACAESENTAGVCTWCALCSAGSNTAHTTSQHQRGNQDYQPCIRRSARHRSPGILGDPVRRESRYV